MTESQITEQEVARKNMDKMQELVFLFNQENIPYLLVGGQAMRLRLSERMTGDIDVLIEDTQGTRLKILNILRERVCYIDVKNVDRILQKRHENDDWSAVRLTNNDDIVFDLMFRAGGMSYQELLEYSENVDLEKHGYVKTINEKGLFLTKCFSMRDKDVADARVLRKMIEHRFGELPDLENGKPVFKKIQKRVSNAWQRIKKKLF